MIYVYFSIFSDAGPINLRIDKIFSNGVKLKWTKGKSCYEIQDILVTFTNNSGYLENRHVSKDADWTSIIGFNTNTNFTIKFVTIYAEDSSDPVYINYVPGLFNNLENCYTFYHKVECVWKKGVHY